MFPSTLSMNPYSLPTIVLISTFCAFKAERAVVSHLFNVSKEALLERARLHAANVELQYLENVNLCLLK